MMEVEDLWASLPWLAELERDHLGRLAGAYLGPVADLEQLGRAELLERLFLAAVSVPYARIDTTAEFGDHMGA